MFYKRRLLMIGCLLVASGVKGMGHENKELKGPGVKEEKEVFQKYNLVFLNPDETFTSVTMRLEGLSLVRHFVELAKLCKRNDKNIKKDSEGNTVLQVTPLTLPAHITIAHVNRFVGFAEGRVALAEIQNDEIVPLIILADMWGAERTDEFKPQRDLLVELVALIPRKLDNKDVLLDTFLQGNGGLWWLIRNLPANALGALNSVMPTWFRICSPVELEAYEGEVKFVLQLRDGRLVSIFWDGNIEIWHKESGEWELGDGSFEVNDEDFFYSVIQLDDGRLALGGDDVITLLKESDGGNWDQDGERLTGHTGSIGSIVQLRDGRLASGAEDGIRIWKQTEGKWLQVGELLRGNTEEVSSVIQLHDGRLVSGAHDGIIRIWTEKDGTWEIDGESLRGQAQENWFVKQLQDGRLISWAEGTKIKIWKEVDGAWVQDGELLDVLSMILSVIQLDDGRLVTGSKDTKIRIWKEVKGKWVQDIGPLEGHTGDVWSLVQLQDGRLASGANDAPVMLWNLRLMSFEQSALCALLSRFNFVWDDIFQNKQLLNIFVSLPNFALHHLIEIQGEAMVRVVLEMLFDQLTSNMLNKEFVVNNQREIDMCLHDIDRLITILNLPAEDVLKIYYTEVKDHADKKKPLVIKQVGKKRKMDSEQQEGSEAQPSKKRVKISLPEEK